MVRHKKTAQFNRTFKSSTFFIKWYFLCKLVKSLAKYGLLMNLKTFIPHIKMVFFITVHKRWFMYTLFVLTINWETFL